MGRTLEKLGPALYSPECVQVTLRRRIAFTIVPVWIYS